MSTVTSAAFPETKVTPEVFEAREAEISKAASSDVIELAGSSSSWHASITANKDKNNHALFFFIIRGFMFKRLDPLTSGHGGSDRIRL
jgi:hypothetical protein